MSQTGSGPRGARPAAENDIYTTLMVISAVFSLAAMIYLIVRASSMYGSALPPPGG